MCFQAPGRKIWLGIFVFGLCLHFSEVRAQPHSSKHKLSIPARETLFDEGWKFFKNDTGDASAEDLDDRTWKTVHLPHDWSVEDLPVQVPDSISGPFSKGSIGGTATGFTEGGTGWYRKTFVLGPADQHKIVTIRFDGVYMDADVWLNGQHIGSHPYGYTSFIFELNRWLKAPGQNNVLAVRVRNLGKNSRWYSGSGIYRHVWLLRTEPAFIPVWGTSITTPEVTTEKAFVNITTSLENRSTKPAHFTLVTFLVAPDGTKAGMAESRTLLKASGHGSSSVQIVLQRPALWSPDRPSLYKAVTYLKTPAGVSDSTTTVFGVRSIQYDSEKGLLLNGKRILLKGGCMHHDNGPLGAAAIDQAEARKIEILKRNGFNAIRTSHNPPSPQLLDACDRLGMLVIDEAFDMWQHPKNPDDYHLYFDQWWKEDIQSMVLRDRNHPSVLFWSIGNEIYERADTSGLRIAKQLVAAVKALDTTRPVTEAICFFWDHPGRSWEATAPAFALLDVGGYNYQWREYENDHRKYPGRVMMGTESFPVEALENWRMVERQPYAIGDFVWTAFDYMGEASIGHTVLSNQADQFTLGWPWYNAWCGDIDLVGNKKAQSFYRDVVWRQSKIEMAVHQPVPQGLTEKVSFWGWPQEWQSWTWPGMEGRLMQVRVFSRSPVVRLYLNGKMLGEKAIADTSITAVFEVPYTAGTLKAVAVERGKEIASKSFQTAGPVKKIRLIPERRTIRNNYNDLAYIGVEVTDGEGRVVPNASLPIELEVSGAGVMVATANADPTDLSGFHRSVKNTFHGRCLLIARAASAKGQISIRASAPGLAPATLTIPVRP